MSTRLPRTWVIREMGILAVFGSVRMRTGTTITLELGIVAKGSK